jgi:hypothetical protein
MSYTWTGLHEISAKSRVRTELGNIKGRWATSPSATTWQRKEEPKTFASGGLVLEYETFMAHDYLYRSSICSLPRGIYLTQTRKLKGLKWNNHKLQFHTYLSLIFFFIDSLYYIFYKFLLFMVDYVFRKNKANK